MNFAFINYKHWKFYSQDYVLQNDNYISNSGLDFFSYGYELFKEQGKRFIKIIFCNNKISVFVTWSETLQMIVLFYYVSYLEEKIAVLWVHDQKFLTFYKDIMSVFSTYLDHEVFFYYQKTCSFRNFNCIHPNNLF